MAFFRKLTSTVAGLATNISEGIKSTVQEERAQFESEKRKMEERKNKEARKKAPCAPWKVANESQTILEAELKERLLKISQDQKTFTSDPPKESVR